MGRVGDGGRWRGWVWGSSAGRGKRGQVGAGLALRLCIIIVCNQAIRCKADDPPTDNQELKVC